MRRLKGCKLSPHGLDLFQGGELDGKPGPRVLVRRGGLLALDKLTRELDCHDVALFAQRV